MSRSSDIECVIEKECGILGEVKMPYGHIGQIRLNKIAWNGGPAKFDIRPWAVDCEEGEQGSIGKGITLTSEQAFKLCELLLIELNNEREAAQPKKPNSILIKAEKKQ